MAFGKENPSGSFREGQRDGQNAGSGERAVHDLVTSITGPGKTQTERDYNAGYEDGSKNK